MPAAVIDPDTQSFATSLSGGSREVPQKAELALSLSSSGSDYVLDFQSGAFTNGLFLSDMPLVPASFHLSASDRTLLGFKTTQFSGSAALADNKAYAASIQLLSREGVGAVGMGNWKHRGSEQAGYLAGFRNVHGAFLIGQATPASAFDKVATGAYSGFSQAGAEGYYWDNFNPFAAKTSVYYDAAAHRITIRLSELSLWPSNYENGSLVVRWDKPASIPFAPTSLACSGPVNPTTGAFTCDFATRLSGKIKGKFFGAQGQYVAGTYALLGSIENHLGGDALVGGFIAQRATAVATPSPQPAWMLSDASLAFTEYVANPKSSNLRVTAPAASSSQPVYAVITDTLGHINADVTPVAIGDSSPNSYDLNITTRSTNSVGTRTGTLQLRICRDDPLLCTQPVSGSPWSIPYSITTKPYPGPGATWQAGVLEGFAYEGQKMYLRPSVLISQPSVESDDPSSETEQYRYTVTDSGVLDEHPVNNFWWNKQPGTFEQGVMLFTLKSGTSAGLYEGVITISVCGLSYAQQATCLPVEQPTVKLPYKVEVRSWSNIKPLSIAPEIAALPNQRGSKDERMSFPLAIDAKQINVRWKIPLPFDAYTWGVGQGFIYGGTHDNGQAKLAVYRESDGQLIWSKPLPKPSDYTPTINGQATSYREDIAISASNSRIYVRMGADRNFVLQVYNALTGAKVFEKECPNCQRAWDQEYGRGWAAFVSVGNDRQGLWMYDDRTDTLNDSTSVRASGGGWQTLFGGGTAEEEARLRTAMFGEAGHDTPVDAQLAAQCGAKRTLSPIAQFARLTSAAYCYYPAGAVARWSIAPAQQIPSDQWPINAEIHALEGGGNIAYIARTSLLVRDARDGHLMAEVPDMGALYQYTPIARSSNLVFVGGENNVQAVDVATQKVVWSMPHPATLGGISNTGVMYAVVKLGLTAEEWALVAINLRP